MAEVEYKGIKVGGTKLLLIIPLLGTIIGGAYAGFEFWTQFQAMEKKIAAYKPVNISHLEKKILTVKANSDSSIAVTEESIAGFRSTVSTLQDLVYDLKISNKEDLSRLQGYLDKQDIRNRANVDLVRTLITDWETRIDSKLSRAELARDQLDKDLRETIRRVLQNPLAAKIN
jgi:hypothetical protein